MSEPPSHPAINRPPNRPRAAATPAVRAALAFGAGVAGWLIGSVVAFAFTGDIAFWLLFVGLFAAGAWIVSVLPLALFGDHDRWFFHPAAAPLVGGACGMLLLMLEFWLFFDVAPWAYAEGMDESDVLLYAIAWLIGGTIWSIYTASMRARRG